MGPLPSKKWTAFPQMFLPWIDPDPINYTMDPVNYRISLLSCFCANDTSQSPLSFSTHPLLQAFDIDGLYLGFALLISFLLFCSSPIFFPYILSLLLFFSNFLSTPSFYSFSLIFIFHMMQLLLFLPLIVKSNSEYFYILHWIMWNVSVETASLFNGVLFYCIKL